MFPGVRCGGPVLLHRTRSEPLRTRSECLLGWCLNRGKVGSAPSLQFWVGGVGGYTNSCRATYLVTYLLTCLLAYLLTGRLEFGAGGGDPPPPPPPPFFPLPVGPGNPPPLSTTILNFLKNFTQPIHKLSTTPPKPHQNPPQNTTKKIQT